MSILFLICLSNTLPPRCVCVSECSVQVRATTFSHMTLTKFTKLTVPRPQQKQPTAVKANHRKCSVSNMMCVTKFNVLIYRLSSNRKSIKRLWSLIEYDSVWVIENTLKKITQKQHEFCLFTCGSPHFVHFLHFFCSLFSMRFEW